MKAPAQQTLPHSDECERAVLSSFNNRSGQPAALPGGEAMSPSAEPGPAVTIIPCAGWAADLGCDKLAESNDWPGQFGGKSLCARCKVRIRADQKAWTWLTS